MAGLFALVDPGVQAGMNWISGSKDRPNIKGIRGKPLNYQPNMLWKLIAASVTKFEDDGFGIGTARNDSNSIASKAELKGGCWGIWIYRICSQTNPLTGSIDNEAEVQATREKVGFEPLTGGLPVDP